jgi:hypothetical protein
MDRETMEILSELGFLHKEYYGTPEAEGLEREEEIPLPPCVAPFGVAMKAASRVMYTMEQAGQTDHPAYAVAKTAVERGLGLITASALEVMLGIFGDNPYGGIFEEVLAATGENAGHEMVLVLPGVPVDLIDPEGREAGIYGGILDGILAAASGELRETPPCLKGFQGYVTLVGKQLSPGFIGALEDGLTGPCHGTGLVGSQGESLIFLFKPETHNCPTRPGEPPYSRDIVEPENPGAKPRRIEIHGPPEDPKPPGTTETH